MPNVFLSIKYHPDLSNRAQIEAICGALEAGGFPVCCVIRDLEDWGARVFAPAELMRRTFAAIEASDVLLVELSEKGVGIGIEAGYAQARGIPIVTAALAGSDLSLTLQAISAWTGFYERVEELPVLVGQVLDQRDSSAKAL